MRSCSRAGALAALALLAGCAGQHRMVADTPVRLGRPYRVGGITYTPADDRDYDRIGVASWYGPGQGRTTANGERFDPRRIGAAHPTLPLPSYVEVTSLATGRRIVVRINDRGPFRGDRLIDLSRGAAQLLGMARAGTVRVRVRRIFPDERTRRLLRSGRAAAPLASVPDEALARLRAPGYQPFPSPVPPAQPPETP